MTLALSTCYLGVLTFGSLNLLAQQVPPGPSALIAVTVTDPLNRLVTGLKQENFSILENGIPRPITFFSGLDSAFSIAVVGEPPLSLGNVLQPQDELIQTSSLSEALNRLIASKNQRKAIVLNLAPEAPEIPAGIQVVQSQDPLKGVVELRNQYLLRFQSSAPSARSEVILTPPRGLPPLKANWKAPGA